MGRNTANKTGLQPVSRPVEWFIVQKCVQKLIKTFSQTLNANIFEKIATRFEERNLSFSVKLTRKLDGCFLGKKKHIS